MVRAGGPDGGKGADICLVEGVGDEEVETATRAATKWSWDSEIVRAAKFGDRGLLIEFSDGPLSSDELASLQTVIRHGRVRQIEEPGDHGPWTVVWRNVPE